MVKAIPFTKKMMQIRARKSLRGLPIESVAGIGKVLGARLRMLGLRTALALKTRTKRMDAEKFIRFMKRSINANCRQSVMCFETLRGSLSQRSIEKACRSRVLGGRLRESCNSIVSSDELKSRRSNNKKSKLSKKKKDYNADYELDDVYITEGHAVLNTNSKSTQVDATFECACPARNNDIIKITCKRNNEKTKDSMTGDNKTSTTICCKKNVNEKKVCLESNKKSSSMVSCFKQCNNLSSKHIDINKIKYINKMLTEICDHHAKINDTHTKKSKQKCFNPYNPREEILLKDSYIFRGIESRKPIVAKQTSSKKEKSQNNLQKFELLDIKMPKSSAVRTTSQKEFDEWFSKYETSKKPILTKSKSLMEFTDRANGKMASIRKENSKRKNNKDRVTKISSSYYLLVV